MNRLLQVFTAVCLLLFSASEIHAQYKCTSVNGLNTGGSNPVVKNSQHITSMLAQQDKDITGKIKPSGKTTSSPERLVAYSSYDFYLPDTVLYALGKTDTGYFIYSGQRGSEFNYNTMVYDIPTNYYDVSYSVYNLYSGSHVTFSGPSYKPGILCDTARIWSSTAADNTGKHLYKYAYASNIHETYDTSNNILVHFDQSYPDIENTATQYLNAYDISGRNTNSISMYWDKSLPVFDSNKSVIHFYNISGKLAMDSVNIYVSPGVWMPLEKWNYNYDVSGNLIRAMYFADSVGVWVEQEQYFISYNIDNTIKTDSEIVYKDGTWMTASYNTYGYTAGVNYFTSYENDVYTNGALSIRNVYTKHVSPSGLPDTLYFKQYNLVSGVAPSYLVSCSRSVFAYDFFNNPVLEYKYHYHITDSATGTGNYDPDIDQITFFYYEAFGETAVRSVTSASEDIKIFPNPVSGALNIRRPGVATGALATLKLINMLGQTVRSMTIPWLTETEVWSLDGVASGTYIFIMEDQKGHSIATQKIIKE